MSTLYDHKNTGDTSQDDFKGVVYQAQLFTPSETYVLTSVRVLLLRNVVAAGDGTMTLAIRAASGGEPTGGNLTYGTLPGSVLQYNNATWHEFTLNTPIEVPAGVQMAIVCYKNGSVSAQWRRGGDTYPGGYSCKSNDSGATWYAIQTTIDKMFENWGEGPAPDPPTVTTQAASEIHATTAVGNGNIIDLGGENCDKRGIVYSESSHSDPGDTAPADSDYEDYEEETDSFGTGAFTRTLTGLTPGVTYYARAYAHNSGGYSYGGEISFTTLTVPVVTTQSVSSILSHNATGNGNITDIGASTPTKRGICWNTAGNPTVADKKKEETGSFGTGAFTEAMTKLTIGAKYYVRAYAYNSYGYGYGPQVQMIGGGVPSESGDGTCYNTWGDWTICRLGNLPQLVAAGESIKAVAYQTASFWIYRGFLYFDLSHVPADFPLARAILQPYGESKGTMPITIVVVEGYQDDPLIAANYQGQASTQTVFGSIASDDVILEAYNPITLNQDGIDLIKSKFGSTLKLCLKDQDDNDDDPMPYNVNRLFTFYPGEDSGKEPILLLYPLASSAQAAVIG